MNLKKLVLLVTVTAITLFHVGIALASGVGI